MRVMGNIASGDARDGDGGGGGGDGAPPLDASTQSIPDVTPHAVVSPPPTLLTVLARLAENGYAREVVPCVNLCRDARANAGVWARIVDLPHRARGARGTTTTRLIYWARYGDVARVHATLDRGARVNAPDSSGWTALVHACYHARLDIVRALLDRGADVNALAVYVAVHAHGSIVLELVARGTDVNARVDGMTLLMCAINMGDMDTVAALLRLGADVNALSSCGRSALMYAAEAYRADIVRVLLATSGVDVNVVSEQGTALRLARGVGPRAAAVVALLEAAGAV